MDATLKITVHLFSASCIEGALAALEAIKHDHPDLFQQAEVVVDVHDTVPNYLQLSGKALAATLRTPK